MGRKARTQPKDLPFKLKFIRDLLSMTQEELYIELVFPRKPDAEECRVGRGSVSDYEHGRRSPSLLDALAYVSMIKRLSRFELTVDDLVNDEIKIADIFIKLR